MARLHTLSLHLDSPDHPAPCAQFSRVRNFALELTYEEQRASARMLQSQADLLAPLLGPSVRHLRLVERGEHEGTWRAYRIYREEDTGNFVRVEPDSLGSDEVSVASDFLVW